MTHDTGEVFEIRILKKEPQEATTTATTTGVILFQTNQLQLHGIQDHLTIVVTIT